MISHLVRRTTLGLAAFAMIALGAGSASAEAPVDVTGPITDPTGVLGSRTADVRSALDDYFDRTGNQLFVVFVPTFDGLDATEWADESAERSGLASQDILLAVATEDRAYGYSIDDAQNLSDAEISRVERDKILPELRDEDWAAAAIAAAEGYADAAGGGVPWVPLGIGGAVVAGGGVLIARRRRGDTGSGNIDKECAAALVRVDNTLTTSEQELAFAEAQFGREATEPFRAVLAEARTTTQSAFVLRQQLDDSTPETAAEHERIATEIIALCEQVEASVAEQVESFDALRDLHTNAPTILAEIPARADEITTRLTTSRAVLERLRAQHPDTTLGSVVGNVDQAEQLVLEAINQAKLGTTALDADDRATAVVHAQAAQEAVAQASTVLQALDDADADIEAAPARIAERLGSIGHDLDDVDRLASTDPAVIPAAEAARSAVAYAATPDRDPLAAVRQLQTAEADLDEALAPARAAAAEAEKARAALADSLGRVTSRVKAVASFIETRRGAVGADARTRLSEAARHLDRAQGIVQSDPTAALEALKQAEHHVDDAERLAQADVRTWEASQRSSGGSQSGGSIILGGIGSSRSRSTRSSSRRRTSTASRRSSRSSSRRRSGGSSRGRRSGGGRF